MHSHESEQMTYILQGALKFLIGGEEITVREGEVLHIPSWVEHQAEALEDTFELDRLQPDPSGLARSHRRLLPSVMPVADRPRDVSIQGRPAVRDPPGARPDLAFASVEVTAVEGGW